MHYEGPLKQGTKPLADEMKYYHWIFRYLLAGSEVGGRGRVGHFSSLLLYSEIES